MDELRQERMQKQGTYKSTLLLMQVMEEAYLWEQGSLTRVEQLRQVSTVLLLGRSMPTNGTIHDHSSRQHSLVLTLYSAWFYEFT